VHDTAGAALSNRQGDLIKPRIEASSLRSSAPSCPCDEKLYVPFGAGPNSHNDEVSAAPWWSSRSSVRPGGRRRTFIALNRGPRAELMEIWSGWSPPWLSGPMAIGTTTDRSRVRNWLHAGCTAGSVAISSNLWDREAELRLGTGSEWQWPSLLRRIRFLSGRAIASCSSS
jgi:hypothetical protein